MDDGGLMEEQEPERKDRLARVMPRAPRLLTMTQQMWSQRPEDSEWPSGLRSASSMSQIPDLGDRDVTLQALSRIRSHNAREHRSRWT